MKDLEDIIKETRAMLDRARVRGLRLATKYEKEYGDPGYLYYASSGGKSWGPLLASVKWFGEGMTTEEEDAAIKLFAQAVIEQEKRDERNRRLEEAHKIHYQRWLADPVNVPYRVPEELLEEFGL